MNEFALCERLDISTSRRLDYILNMACIVPASFHASIPQDEVTASTEQSTEGVFVQDALTATLQIAFEAAVFSNRFEIDEQEPIWRA